MYFDTWGKIRYSPKRLGEQSSPNWYVIIDADPAIGKYYRKLYSLAHFACKIIERPSWESHCCIVRNEVPSKPKLWEAYSGKKIWLRCFPELIASNGFYWWIPVYCEAALNLRKELGLSREPLIPFHLTIGHNPENERISRIPD